MFTFSRVGQTHPRAYHASATLSLDKFLKRTAEDGNDYLSAKVYFTFHTVTGGDTKFLAVHEDTRTSVGEKSLFNLEDVVYPPPSPPPTPALSGDDLDMVFYEYDLNNTDSLNQIDFIRRREKHFLGSNSQHVLCALVKFSEYTLHLWGSC